MLGFFYLFGGIFVLCVVLWGFVGGGFVVAVCFVSFFVGGLICFSFT